MRDWISGDRGTAAERSEKTSTAKIDELREVVERVIRGKSETVKYALVALLGKGHLLIEDVPGIGKTTLANALSRALGLDIQRVQFTSDLLPTDVIGLSVFNQQDGVFSWKPGPIFSNIVIADEINRATPKTQSALLEAMAEEQVTAEGVTRALPQPFMVIATQNPVEHHGTYPLPESQLDRFMLRLHMGYPSSDDEKKILLDRANSDPMTEVKPVMSSGEVMELQNMVADVKVDDALLDYLLSIVDQTRTNDEIELGISPRGTLALFRSAQALALINGRNYCIADDIKSLVVACFAHRLVLSGKAAGIKGGKKREAEMILQGILSNTAVPV